MKRFVVKVICFSVALLFFGAALDFLLCKGLLKMEDYRFQDYEAMLTGGMENDILIMGNSRGKSHFNPSIIDSLSHSSSFCIGIGGYPIDAQVMKYHLYREHNRKPRLIIQNVDYATVTTIDDIRHQHQSEQFFPLVFDRKSRKELKKLGYGFFELYVPLYRFFGYQQVIKNGLLEILGLKHYVSRPAYKGFRAEEGAWDGAELAAMDRHKVEMSDKGKEILESYLSACRADSIDVVLVNSPMYVGVKGKLLGLDEARAYFEQLAEEYQCIYLDFVDDYPISQDTSNFCVSVHMNPVATDVFTRELCDSLIKLNKL